MEKQTQTAAFISLATRARLERHSRTTVVMVHPKLIVTRVSGAAILMQTQTGKPTNALRVLMRDGD